MKTIKIITVLTLTVTTIVLASSWTRTIPQQTTRWKAPASADAIVNPLKGNTASVAAGKVIYDKFCAMCHGNKGRGDGVAAAGLQVPPADHSSKLVQSQSDGAIYWKITEGRNPMASYKATLTETQRWQVVNYMRTLANPNAKK